MAGAVVRLRATENATLSDEQGRFALSLPGYALHRTVTAWKEGYYIGGADVTGFPAEVTIRLRPHTAADNPGSGWLPSDPDPAVELACGNCHAELHAAWRADAHAQAATKPLVQSMFTGADRQGQPGVGPGFLLDSPEEPGNCAACHAPAAPDLSQLEGEAVNGVFCQFCHSVSAARTPYAETTAGVHAVTLLRPPPSEHLFIGPFDDVTGRDTFSPVQASSRQCAACHSGGWWGVPAYTSFDEWQASAYAAAGVQCQDCHMPALGSADDPPVRVVSACAPNELRSSTFAKSRTSESRTSELGCIIQSCIDCHITGKTADRDPTTASPLIPPRNPATLSNHKMRGADDPDFLRGAVTLVLTATRGADGVLAEVALTNRGAGHSIPTDGWTRSLLLLVEAFDSDGALLDYRGPEFAPEWAGIGPVAEGNYAGLAGKGFARLLEDWEGNAPAPPWRNGIRVLRDNRIPAGGADTSRYLFALPAADGPVRVTARLIHRRLYKEWADAKGFPVGDTPMAEAEALAAPSGESLAHHLTPGYDASLFAPARATTTDGRRLDSSHAARPQECAACHTAAFESWQASGHARAATAPLYRARVKVASQNTEADIPPLCAGCHSPVGLLSGQIRTRWSWFGQESRPLDEAALSGVQCAVCHAIEAISGPGDGAYVLDPARLAASTVTTGTAQSHPQMTPIFTDAIRVLSEPCVQPCSLIAAPEFCAVCHEGTSPAPGFRQAQPTGTGGLPVMTTFSEWQASRFNTGDPATTVTCQGCHFADGRHGELRPSDLQAAATVDLALEANGDGGISARVTITNSGAGHSLPTGATELQQFWLEVRATDAAGRELFRSGGVDAYGDPGEDAVTFGTVWLDGEGRPTERHWEAASVLRDQRIAAGEAFTATFAIPLPRDAQLPVRVQAALNYRAAAGYLTGLMSIYVQEEIPPPPTIPMAEAEVCWGCPAQPGDD